MTEATATDQVEAHVVDESDVKKAVAAAGQSHIN